jgi:hypothetical protein
MQHISDVPKIRGIILLALEWYARKVYLMNQLKKLAFVPVSLSLLYMPLSSHAAQKLPEEFHPEAYRDTNLLQLEPTIINERYYTSGRAETNHHFTLNTLPEGAPIPDVDPPEAIKKQEKKPEAKAPDSVSSPATTSKTADPKK